MHTTISLTVNKRAIAFAMTPEIYNKYIDELQVSKKVGPTHNMLMRAVTEETKPALKELLAMPGAGMMIAGELVEAYAPDIEVLVGE